MWSRCQRTAGAVWGAVLVAALGAVPAAAQPPAFGQPVVQKKYTDKTEFNLPITIEPGAQSSLKEVCLYVKTPSTEWQRQQTAPPTQSGFKFRAQQDGEYWFSVVTIDKFGAAMPVDVSREPPAVVVVVDTQPPQFNLNTWTAPTGEVCLRCNIQDANADYQGVKITYQGADQTWCALDPYPGQAGAFRVPNANLLSGTVRVVARDLARNTTQRDLSVKELLAAAAPKSQGTVQQVAQPGNTNVAMTPNNYVPPTVNQVVTPPTQVATPNQGVVQATNQVPVFPSNPPVLPVPTEVKMPRPPLGGNTAVQNGAPRQLINTTHATVDYKIESVGPSGVGKVEIWMTGDSGNSWKRLCEDHDRRSPAEIDLPGEGLFGLRLVVTNGNGFGGHTPARGDNPTNWIEVDATPPYAQLKEIEPVSNGSTIDIRWAVSDKNLSPEPVNLYYATRREGPWVVVAKNLKNDGRYPWAFPRDQGAQFFIRLQAFDLAGNVSQCETASPIQLDMTEPQVQVLGITGVSVAPAQQRGN